MTSPPDTKFANNWACSDVSVWMRQIGFAEYVELFLTHKIDGEVLLTMTEQDLKSPPLNLTVFGHIRKIGRAIEKLQKKVEPNFRADSPGPSENFTNEFTRALQKSMKDSASVASGATETTLDRKALESAKLLSRAENIKGFYPKFCWQYDENQEHLLKLFLNCEDLTDVKFSAEVSHLVSPVEFYLHPLFLLDEIHRLKAEMADYYNTEVLDTLPFNTIVYEGMPCAAIYSLDGSYYRAKVTHFGAHDCKLSFIDWGNGQFESYASLKPLVEKFGKLPPLAFRCRIHGVVERTLVQKKLDEFRQEIEGRLENLVQCTIKRVENGVFFVELLDPKTKENLGAKFYPTEPIVPGFELNLPGVSVPSPIADVITVTEEIESVDVVCYTNQAASEAHSSEDEDDDVDVKEINSTSSSSSSLPPPPCVDRASPAPLPVHEEHEPEMSDFTQVLSQLRKEKGKTSSADATLLNDFKTDTEKHHDRVHVSSTEIKTLLEQTVIAKNEASASVSYASSHKSTVNGSNGLTAPAPIVHSNQSATPKFPATPTPTPVGSWVPAAASFSLHWPDHQVGGVKQVGGVDPQLLRQQIAEKEAKMKKGGYANTLEAFLDGAPVCSSDEDFDEDDYDYDQNKRKKGNGKKKLLNQAKVDSNMPSVAGAGTSRGAYKR